MFTAVSQYLELLPIPDSGRELISQCMLLATDNVKFTLLFLQLFQQRQTQCYFKATCKAAKL